MSVTALQSLAQVSEQSVVHIQSIKTDSATRMRLLGMGLGKGCTLQVLRNRLGDLVLGSGNNRISLGRSITRDIFVTLTPHS